MSSLGMGEAIEAAINAGTVAVGRQGSRLARLEVEWIIEAAAPIIAAAAARDESMRSDAEIADLRAEIDRLRESSQDYADEAVAAHVELDRALAEIDRLREPHDGAGLIAAERRRQIEVEGYTAEHDAQHGHPEELARAAACYASGCSDGWPWRPRDYKPGRDRLRELVKAGALIAAAIDAYAPVTS